MNGNARKKRTTKKRGAAAGFTLVELLLVLVILALIGGLVLPGIIGKAEGAKVGELLPGHRHHAGESRFAGRGVR
jgi:prepilin-type N-terminal cleavage/methylation domain-containing protein